MIVFMNTLVIHNIRSAHNVGAMLRTAEAIGIDDVVISGFSAGPIDRFGRENPKVTKAAVGAHNLVSWTQAPDILEYLQEQQKLGRTIVSVEQDSRSVDYKAYQPTGDMVIIMGNEVTGVDQEILDLSDIILELPMTGEKESLNVTTSCGIILYRLLDR